MRIALPVLFASLASVAFAQTPTPTPDVPFGVTPTPTGATSPVPIASPVASAAASPTATPEPEKEKHPCFRHPRRKTSKTDREEERYWVSRAAYLDQDVLWEDRNEDRNYTMGVGFAISGRVAAARDIQFLRCVADTLTGLRSVHTDRFLASSNAQESHSLLLGGSAFTPDELRDTEPIRDDRPYSSIEYLTIAKSTINPDEKHRDVLTTELTIGVLGLGVGGDIQTLIHRGIGGEDCRVGEECQGPYWPRGWHQQISNGGEPTAKYRVAYARALDDTQSWWDTSMQVEASAGYYTNAAAGGMIRVGHIRSDFWQVAANPLSAANQAFGKSGPATRVRDRDHFEAYVFASGRERLVLYNALLEGQGRKSPHTLRQDQVERFVAEGEAGVTIAGGPISVTASLNVRTSEIKVGKPRTHAWGGAYIVWRAPVKKPKDDTQQTDDDE